MKLIFPTQKTYVIRDETTKQTFEVNFDHPYQLDTWIEMEKTLHGKLYTLVNQNIKEER